jgi:hypothetical protein
MSAPTPNREFEKVHVRMRHSLPNHSGAAYRSLVAQALVSAAEAGARRMLVEEWLRVNGKGKLQPSTACVMPLPVTDADS